MELTGKKPEKKFKKKEEVFRDKKKRAWLIPGP